MSMSFLINKLHQWRLLLPPANEVWCKVIFSEACAKNSVHRGECLGRYQCMLGDTGHKRAVRILLECILVG